MDKSFLVGRVYQAEDIFLSEDDLNNPLGGGGFGVVVRAFTPKLGVVAVKCLDFTAGGTMLVEELIQKMPYEAKNMHMLNHTNIVRMHGFTTWPGYFGIIQDYMPVGNLESFLENTKPSLTMRLRIALDISNALCYLHGFDEVNKIVHGDIKPKNILLDDGLRAKLIDFGTIQIIAHTTTRKTLSTKLGRQNSCNAYSLHYCCPEFLENLFNSRKASQDVYSFGMVVYHILTRKVPFGEFHDEHYVKEAIIGKQRPSLNKDALQNCKSSEKNLYYCLQDVMKQCWSHVPSERPKISVVREQLQKALFADNHCRNLGLEMAEDAVYLLKQLNVKLEPLKQIKKEKTLKDFTTKCAKTFANTSLISSDVQRSCSSTFSDTDNMSPKLGYQCETTVNTESSSLDKVGDPIVSDVPIQRVHFVSPKVEKDEDRTEQVKPIIRINSEPKSPDSSGSKSEYLFTSKDSSQMTLESYPTFASPEPCNKDYKPSTVSDLGYTNTCTAEKSRLGSLTETMTIDDDLNHVFAVSPNTFLLDDAGTCMNKGLYDEAIELLKKYKVEDGNELEQIYVDMKLAFCYFKQMNLEEGNSIFEEAFKKLGEITPSKKLAAVLYDIAEMYRTKGMESRAMFLYSSVMQVCSKQDWSNVNLAVLNNCLTGMVRNDQQLNDGTPAKKKNIEIFRGMMHKLSGITDKHGKIPEALCLGYYYLGRCYSQRDDGKSSSHYNKRAVQAMQTAYPDSYKKFYMVSYAMHNLAVNQEKIGRNEDALRYFQKAIQYMQEATNWDSIEERDKEMEHTLRCQNSLRCKMGLQPEI